MYRLMQPSDEAAVVALWQQERGDSAETSSRLLWNSSPGRKISTSLRKMTR